MVSMEYFDREFYSKIQEASFSVGVYWICKRFIDLTEGVKKKKDCLLYTSDAADE